MVKSTKTTSVLDATDSNTVVKTYTWGLDLSQSLQGAGGVGGLLCVTENPASSTPSRFYPSYDANGNISEYVDDSDSVVAHYEYSPFGKITSSSGSKSSDFDHRYSTKYFDDETNLYYYGYRYYSSELGRWLSRDPIGERGGLNILAYEGNSPINTFEYLGLGVYEGVMQIMENKSKGEFDDTVPANTNEIAKQVANHIPNVGVGFSGTFMFQTVGSELDVKKDLGAAPGKPYSKTYQGTTTTFGFSFDFSSDASVNGPETGIGYRNMGVGIEQSLPGQKTRTGTSLNIHIGISIPTFFFPYFSTPNILAPPMSGQGYEQTGSSACGE